MDEDMKFLKPFSPQGKLQMNLAHKPEHTFFFDTHETKKLEDTFDRIKFFSDIDLGITMKDFILQETALSEIFVPVTSFDNSTVSSSNDEFVAMIEGVVYPWFGTAYRIDKIQFSMERTSVDLVDHSREAIVHAQGIANLFVDEARLSPN